MKNLTQKLILMITLLATIGTTKAQSISSEFNYQSKFLAVNGHQLHFYEAGEGDPILFLHGMPMSAFSWRNVIPNLSDSARCIALDFMGFGKSDKPNIEYTFDDQYAYLEAFIDSLQLRNITLVMTDIGGILGQRYARSHSRNIKGMVFMETPISDAETFHKTGGMMQRMMFWMAGKDKLGYRMFVKKNMFIKMMPMLIKRNLNKQEKEMYAAPFKTEKSRTALFTMPNSFPKKGRNAIEGDMGDYLNKNTAWLLTSEHPKLIVTAKPGMLMTTKVMEWIQINLSNAKIENVGKAKHLMEEDLPLEIGQSIKKWYFKLD